MKYKNNKLITNIVLFCFIFLIVQPGYAVKKDSEEKGLELLKEGEILHEKFDYNGAMDKFLKARVYMKSKQNLSRLYLAMSVTYYCLENKVKTGEILQKMFEIEPGKQILEEQYPRGYLEIYRKTRKQYSLKKVSPDQKIIQKTEVTEEPAKKIESDKIEPAKVKKKKVTPRKKLQLPENGTLEKLGEKKEEKKKKKFPVLLVVLGAAAVAALVFLLAGGKEDPQEEEVYDIRGDWTWTLLTLDGEQVNKSYDTTYSGTLTSGTYIAGGYPGTYTVSGRNVEMRAETGSVYTGTFNSHTTISGSGTHSTGVPATWNAVRK